MTILTVGTGQSFTTIAAAIAASKDGDTVQVQAGLYVDDFATIKTKITLQSVGGLAILKAVSAPPNGKAILTTDADVTIDGFGFTGAAVSDNNGAGIRYELGNLVVKNSIFWDNQNGILAAPDPNGTILIDNSEFSHNGAGDGRSHNIYIGEVASLVVKNSYFHDSTVGHEIKSRAHNTTIVNNRIFDNNGDGSYSIDIPDGGNAVIQGNIIEKGANAPNYTTIHFGGENGPYPYSKLAITGNTIINDNANGILLNNAAMAPVTFSNNSLYGYATANYWQNNTASTVTVSGTQVLTTRPTLDLTSKAPIVPIIIPPKIVEVPPTADYLTFGLAGAVTASGHILTVGAQGQFKTLASALAASVDGDTIQVAAGTYTNDIGSVNHKVIIEGVGGIANFVQKNLGGQYGVLTVNTDATLRNLSFSGGHGGLNSHEGGVTITAGNVTIANSSFFDNDIGINVLANPNTTVSVFGSDIGANGNADKGTHNITVGSVASFTLKDSYVHGALTGHEIWDRAYNTVIDGNRIIDGTAAAASFLIGLGQGGNAKITNNVLEKGRNAQNGVFVLVGGEGAIYDNTNVAIASNTLVSDMVNPDHPYTYFLNSSEDAKAVGPTVATNNTFIGGVPGSQQGVNVQLVGSKVATSTTLNTSSPVSAALAPTAMVRQSTGPNTLTFTLSGSRAVLDPQFAVSVDGVVVGGGVVDTSIVGAQTVSFFGKWAAGPHQVTLTGTNLFTDKTDLGGIAAAGITVQKVSLDNETIQTSANLFYANQSYSLTIGSGAGGNAGEVAPVNFDAQYYMSHYPSVQAAGISPLTDFMTTGWKLGRNPSAVFDVNYYLSHNPDVKAAKVNPLLHFTASGWHEGRDPSASFTLKSYYAAHPAAANGSVDPLTLYAQSGETRLYNDPLYDTAYYSARTPSVGSDINAVINDYTVSGWQAGKSPSAWFNTSYYLWANPDVAAAKINPLLHYETYGWYEGRNANPWFSDSAYATANPGKLVAGIDPLVSFLENGGDATTPQTSGYLQPIARMFNSAFYLAHNADVKAAGMDPLEHFERVGWKEGRDPSATFSSSKYLAANRDVAAAGLDPLYHYATWGQYEGRAIFPS